MDAYDKRVRDERWGCVLLVVMGFLFYQWYAYNQNFIPKFTEEPTHARH